VNKRSDEQRIKFTLFLFSAHTSLLAKYLYTLCVFDSEKADKPKKSLPLGLSIQEI
jgi:Ribosomal L38e protein family